MLTRVDNGMKRRVSGPHDDRLPLHGHEPGAFDFPEVNRMSDEERAERSGPRVLIYANR